MHKATSFRAEVLPRSHQVPVVRAGRVAREADVTDAPGVPTRVRA